MSTKQEFDITHMLAGNLSIFYSKLSFCPFIEYPIFTFITIPFCPTALFTTFII